jgi:signal peptidase II
MKTIKLSHVVLIILLIILVDQSLKIWIKTTYDMGDTNLTGIPGKAGNVSWFRLHFIENPGMAWGWKFWGQTGKTILTLFRLAAVIFGTWYLGRIVKQKYTRGFVVCAALIYAGALGNLIDSMFYGLVFDKGLIYVPASDEWVPYSGIAHFTSFGNGYAPFLQGCVVDMLHFPIIDSTWPSWVPFIGGNKLEFFSPIFNIADASISVGVITLLIFQKRFFKKYQPDPKHPVVETNTEISDKVQVL